MCSSYYLWRPVGLANINPKSEICLSVSVSDNKDEWLC